MGIYWVGALFLLIFFTSSSPATAVCPVCTVAVGAGLGLSRWLGVDDTVSGLWIGGLILSLGLWSAGWLERRTPRFPRSSIILSLVFYFLTIGPLYFAGLIGHPGNTFWGIDKLLLGTGAGSALFLGSIGLDKYCRSANRGKGYFAYQRVALPVLVLLVASLIFFWLTRRA